MGDPQNSKLPDLTVHGPELGHNYPRNKKSNKCRSGERNTPSFKPYPHQENLRGVDLTTRISSR